MESMKTYDNIYKSLCRVCLKQNNEENMFPLLEFSNSDGLSCFGKAVLTFARITIKSDDVFPSSMCNDCLHCLKQAIYFKLKCETSDKRLKKIANSCASERELKEKVVEYSMFKTYFTSEDLEDLAGSDIKHQSKSQVYLQKTVGKENLDVEVTESQESFSDDFIDNLDGDEPNSSYFNGKRTNLNEDGDTILDRIERLIGTHADISTIQFKRGFKKRTFNHEKKMARRRQMQLRNNGSETFNCNVCHRVLANKHSYENHMQRHNGCRYVCEHCGKGFPVLTELQIHQVSVHGTGPYLQCQQCPYKAPRKFSLIEHERIHTGERPYACEKCGLTFRRRFVWKKHLIYHSEKTVQCNLCPRKFYLRSEMLAHCNNVHERMYVYLCNKCGATYAKPATVRRHLTERHGVPREMQGKVIRINKGKGSFPE